MRVHYFGSINLKLPRDKIYARLGYAMGLTRLPRGNRRDVEGAIEDSAARIRLKGTGKRVVIAGNIHGVIILENKRRIKSASLSGLLKECDEALFMGATAGRDIIKSIRNFSNGGEMEKAVIYDAVASEMTDGALDWISAYFSRQIRREDKYLTRRRFSPGYGDFKLSGQKLICEELEMNRLGVSLTRSFVMVPEKSVTAVCGIRRRA